MSCCDQPGLMPVEAALERLLEQASAGAALEIESVELAEADGRVLAEPLISSLDLPPWANSAMDGYALALADWQGTALQVSQRIQAGTAPTTLQPGTCARIFTGAPLPAGADTVEMQENVELAADGSVQRGDVGTVKAHIESLRGDDSSAQALALYRALAQVSLEQARREQAIEQGVIDQLEELLAGSG